MPENRCKYDKNDILLSPKDHPAGTLLILTFSYSSPKTSRILQEALVLKWSPSDTLVKLKYINSGNVAWIDPTHYAPIVVEILDTGVLIPEDNKPDLDLMLDCGILEK